MRYYSEKTGKIYNTPEEVEAAESALDKEIKELEKAKEERKLAAQRVKAAREKADEELRKFCEKYGSYHDTIAEKNVIHRPSDILVDLLFNLPF